MHSLSRLLQYCPMKFNTRLAHRTHLAATIAVMASNSIRTIPNRVYVKQTGGLQSCLASPIYLPVDMKSDGSHYTCLKTKNVLHDTHYICPYF